MSKWHKGPPPSVGWWQASGFEDPSVLRWWNGNYWSTPAHNLMTSKQAAKEARYQSGLSTKIIKWMHRPKSWPARSRT